jgi:hypothetical protein
MVEGKKTGREKGKKEKKKKWIKNERMREEEINIFILIVSSFHHF